MEETSVQAESKAIAAEYRAFRDVKTKEISEFIHKRAVLFAARHKDEDDLWKTPTFKP